MVSHVTGRRAKGRKSDASGEQHSTDGTNEVQCDAMVTRL